MLGTAADGLAEALPDGDVSGATVTVAGMAVAKPGAQLGWRATPQLPGCSVTTCEALGATVLVATPLTWIVAVVLVRFVRVTVPSAAAVTFAGSGVEEHETPWATVPVYVIVTVCDGEVEA